MGQWVGPGLWDVGSYQMAGVPYVTNVGTGTTSTITFKFVTSQVVLSVASTATVDFQDSGGPTTMSLTTGVHTFNVRTDRIRIQAVGGDVGVCASLTPIDAKHFTLPDQSNYGSG